MLPRSVTTLTMYCPLGSEISRRVYEKVSPELTNKSVSNRRCVVASFIQIDNMCAVRDPEFLNLKTVPLTTALTAR